MSQINPEVFLDLLKVVGKQSQMVVLMVMNPMVESVRNHQLNKLKVFLNFTSLNLKVILRAFRGKVCPNKSVIATQFEYAKNKHKLSDAIQSNHFTLSSCFKKHPLWNLLLLALKTSRFMSTKISPGCSVHGCCPARQGLWW